MVVGLDDPWVHSTSCCPDTTVQMMHFTAAVQSDWPENIRWFKHDVTAVSLTFGALVLP